MSAAWFSSVRTPVKRIEGLVTASQIPAASAASFFCLRSRVEDGRGGLGHAATLHFPSPLIKPDVRISRIRLSDWFHREAHERIGRARLLLGRFFAFTTSRRSNRGRVRSFNGVITSVSPSLKNAPEVRALSSIGVTQLQ